MPFQTTPIPGLIIFEPRVFPDERGYFFESYNQRTWEEAGVTAKDIKYASIYDSFTITVLMTLEALGFCGRGEAGGFVAGSRIAPGGSFPMNTNGGGLSCTHPPCTASSP